MMSPGITAHPCPDVERVPGDVAGSPASLGLCDGAVVVVALACRVTPALRARAMTAVSAALASPSPLGAIRVSASAR